MKVLYDPVGGTRKYLVSEEGVLSTTTPKEFSFDFSAITAPPINSTITISLMATSPGNEVYEMAADGWRYNGTSWGQYLYSGIHCQGYLSSIMASTVQKEDTGVIQYKIIDVGRKVKDYCDFISSMNQYFVKLLS
ncbi:MAG: hypothetical protein JSR76_07910 [Verrucomicrobia bacterium]|nr:hypothetical protein [Verrucomicrobiota bacterium]